VFGQPFKALLHHSFFYHTNSFHILSSIPSTYPSNHILPRSPYNPLTYGQKKIGHKPLSSNLLNSSQLLFQSIILGDRHPSGIIQLTNLILFRYTLPSHSSIIPSCLSGIFTPRSTLPVVASKGVSGLVHPV